MYVWCTLIVLLQSIALLSMDNNQAGEKPESPSASIPKTPPPTPRSIPSTPKTPKECAALILGRHRSLSKIFDDANNPIAQTENSPQPLMVSIINRLNTLSSSSNPTDVAVTQSTASDSKDSI